MAQDADEILGIKKQVPAAQSADEILGISQPVEYGKLTPMPLSTLAPKAQPEGLVETAKAAFGIGQTSVEDAALSVSNAEARFRDASEKHKAAQSKYIALWEDFNRLMQNPQERDRFEAAKALRGGWDPREEGVNSAREWRGSTESEMNVAFQDLLKQKGLYAHAKHPAQGFAFDIATKVYEPLGISKEDIIRLMVKGAARNEGGIEATGEFLKDFGQTALPFVPSPESTPDVQRAAASEQMASEQLRGEHGLRRFGEDLASTGGFLAATGGVRAPIEAATRTIAERVSSPIAKALLGAKGVGEASALHAAVPAATAMGVVSAEPAISDPNATKTDVLRSFVEGVKADAMLRAAGRIGASLPEQYGHAGIKFLRDRAVQRALAPAGAGVAQGVLQTVTNPEEGNIATQLGSNIATNVTMGYLPGARGLVPGLKGSLKAADSRPVDTTRPPTAGELDAANAPRTTGIPLQRDPSFETLLTGDRDVYLNPKSLADGGITAPTEAEKAQTANPLDKKALAKYGVETLDTPAGEFSFRRDSLEKRLAEDDFAKQNITVWTEPMTGRDPDTGMATISGQPKPNVEASIKKAVETGNTGWLLRYGEGNESKPDPTDPNAKTVTFYDRYGREVTTILARNPDSAVKALEQYHGAKPGTGARIEIKPIAEGLRDVLKRRGIDTSDPMELPDAPKPPIARGPGDAPASREGGFLNLSIFGRKKSAADKANEELQKASKRRLQTWVPQFSNIEGPSPDVYKSFLRTASAEYYVDTFSRDGEHQLRDLLPSPKMQEIAGKLLHEMQAEGGVAQGRPVPEHLMMSKADRAYYEANKEAFVPFLEAWGNMNAKLKNDLLLGGLQSTRPIREGGQYAHLSPVDFSPVELPDSSIALTSPRLKKLLDTGAREGRETLIGDPEIIAALKSGQPIKKGSPLHAKLQSMGLLGEVGPKKAGAAKRASFQSPVYSNDLGDILRQTASDATAAGTRNDLILSLRQASEQYVPKQENGEYPKTVMYDGKPVKVTWTDIGDLPPWMSNLVGKDSFERLNSIGTEKIPLPQPLADSYAELRRMDPYRPTNVVKKASDVITSLDTTITIQDTPRLVLHNLAALGGVPASRGRIDKLLQLMGGPPRFALGVARALDISKADEPIIDHLQRHGALDMRSFGEAEGVTEGFSENAFKWVPGAPFAQQIVFGKYGAVNRARTAFYKLLRYGNFSDAEALNEVVRVFGTPVKQLQPGAVQFMTGSTLDPYFNADYRVMNSAARAFGIGGKKYNTADRIRVATGSITGLLLSTAISAMANKDDDTKLKSSLPPAFRFTPQQERHHYAFEHAKTFMANEERFMRRFGVSGLIDNVLADNISWDTAERALKYTGSQWTSRLGPIPGFAADLFGADRFSTLGKEIPQPTPTQAFIRMLPAGDAAVRAYQEEKNLSMRENRDVNWKSVAGMTAIGAFAGVTRSKPKTEEDIAVDIKKLENKAKYDMPTKIALSIWGSGAVKDDMKNAEALVNRELDSSGVDDPLDRAHAKKQALEILGRILRSDKRTRAQVKMEQGK